MTLRSYRCYIAILFFFGGVLCMAQTDDIDTSELTIGDLQQRLEAIELQLEAERENSDKIQVGLSFGFNYFRNASLDYYVAADSSLGVYGNRTGVSGMLSAMLGYRFKPNHSILINIPLGDFSGDPNRAIGVFNKRIAGGLGYGFNMDQLALIGVVNLYPYEEVALDVVQGKKLPQEPFTIPDVSNLPKQNNVSPSITIGVCYYFIGKRKDGMLML